MSILITGGAGFIGSHACLALLEAGENIVVLDNLSNSSQESLKRVESLVAGNAGGQPIPFIQADLRDKQAVRAVFAEHTDIEAVIHFAGLKAVGESVSKPLLYYQNNVEGSLNLFEAMDEAGVRTLIFSSSATVYGDPESVPINEAARIQPTNPYGHSKTMVEVVLEGLASSSASGKLPVNAGSACQSGSWKIALLRYFNPVGAHPSGQIGEDPNDVPNNLLPYVSKVAIGELKELSVFGDDYPTVDGTGVRDYIHVIDLVDGHVSALNWLKQQNNEQAACEVFNLGTGQGYSVLEMIKAFEQASKKTVAYKVVERRAGDIATCYADASKAKNVLGWEAKRSLEEMMRDAWCWQKNNPSGYSNN